MAHRFLAGAFTGLAVSALVIGGALFSGSATAPVVARAPQVVTTAPATEAPAAPTSPALDEITTQAEEAARAVVDQAQTRLAEVLEGPSETPSEPAPAMPQSPQAEPPAAPVPPASEATASAAPEATAPAPARGETPEALADASADPLPEVEADTPPPPQRPDGALAQYAAEVAAPLGQPRLSVVLIDDGQGPWTPEALRSFPFPLTIALAAAHPDATAASLAYRALGFDVLALSGTASDLPRAIEAVPGAVGVLDTSGDLPPEGVALLRAEGMGAVVAPETPEPQQREAAQGGVPTAAIFRDFDRDGEAGDVVRRLLEAAADRARSDGHVVVLGRLSATTVGALVRWGLEGPVQDLALVPVSRVLLEQID